MADGKRQHKHLRLTKIANTHLYLDSRPELRITKVLDIQGERRRSIRGKVWDYAAFPKRA